jgi:hypothetical protein
MKTLIDVSIGFHNGGCEPRDLHSVSIKAPGLSNSSVKINRPRNNMYYAVKYVRSSVREIVDFVNSFA